MSKVLYVKANPNTGNESHTLRISEAFIEEYKRTNPEDEITTLNLYESDIDFLRAEDMPVVAAGGKFDGDHKIIRYAKAFAESDKYVVAAPMWNFGFPAILKAYLDYISISGITFEYASEGPRGLLGGKARKAICITTRGGTGYDGATKQYNFSNTHLQALFGFLGISEFQTIAFEGSAMSERKDKIGEVIETATQAAKSF